MVWNMVLLLPADLRLVLVLQLLELIALVTVLLSFQSWL